MSTEKPSPKTLKNKKHAAQDNQNDDTKTSDKSGETEIGGYKDAGLPEPTRYNDWEVKGRCSDF